MAADLGDLPHVGRTIVSPRPPDGLPGDWVLARHWNWAAIAASSLAKQVRDHLSVSDDVLDTLAAGSEEWRQGYEAALSEARGVVAREIAALQARLEPAGWRGEDGPGIEPNHFVCVDRDHPAHVRANCTCTVYQEVPVHGDAPVDVRETDPDCPWHRDGA